MELETPQQFLSQRKQEPVCAGKYFLKKQLIQVKSYLDKQQLMPYLNRSDAAPR